MKPAKKLVLVLLLLTVVASARKRDPLTDAETDQLREAAMEPYKRLKLYIKFAQARLFRQGWSRRKDRHWTL